MVITEQQERNLLEYILRGSRLFDERVHKFVPLTLDRVRADECLEIGMS